MPTNDSGSLPPQPARSRRRRWLWFTGIAAGCVAVAAVLLLVLSRQAGAPQVEAVPLTSEPGLELEPRLSPNGSMVAYVWNGPAADNFDVYVKPLSGGTPVRLTTDPAHDYSPAWSPDGRTIAFLRQTSADRAAVYVIPASGGEARRIAETGAHSWPHWHFPGPFLAWSSDGRWLVVPAHGNDSAFALARLSVATGGIERLTDPPAGSWGDAAPAISADGRSLAFSRCTGWAVSGLYVLPLTPDLAAAGPARRIETRAKWNASPAWLPDGRLVFSTGVLESPYLAAVRPAGSARVQSLGPDGGNGWQPAVAAKPGGGSFALAFARHFEVVNIWRQDLSTRAAPARWIASSRRDLTPNYTPDGSRIAFTSDRSGSEQIWVAASDGTGPSQWTAFQHAHVGAPRWSPDGRRIAFDAQDEGKFRIFTTEGPGRQPRLLLESDQPVWLPVWTPGGQSIVFAAAWSGRSQLWKIPSSGGPAAVVTSAEATDPWFSADGRFLYYLGGGAENHIWRMPAGGGAPQRVADWCGDFTAGARGIYFTRFRPGEGLGDRAIDFLDPATGRTATVVSDTGVLRPGLALSPDGRYLLFAQVAYDVSDLMLARRFIQ